uniref:Dynein regulatory complex protein 12 n=1 Tax=Mantoniella antarctica TaxID=81844 RepID=A0A7S0X2J3_9CHLO
MALKKKGGKKKETDPAELANVEKLRFAEVEVAALQQRLDVKEHETATARSAERDWRGQVQTYGGQLAAQREDALDITADMSRQFQTMQHRLQIQIDTLEKDVHDLSAVGREKDQVIQRITREFEAAAAAKDLEVSGLRQSLEDMAQQFSDMLKETLDKMTERMSETA